MSMAMIQTEPELIETFVKCERCEGKGSIVDDWPRRANKPGEEQTISCPDCDGTGEFSKEVMTCCGLSDYECECVTIFGD